MPSLANLLEDYRNWRGRSEWEQGKAIQDIYGGDPRGQEQFEKFGGFGTDAGGLVGMIKASHGSPHAFTKFLMSKLGTGEGAQAYGHGMYFGEGFDSPVAKQYRDKLSTGDYYVNNKLLDAYNPMHFLASALNQESGDLTETLSHLNMMANRGGSASIKDTARAAIELFNKGERPSLEYIKPEGHLYNVELKWPDAAREAADPLGPEHFLQWDRPMMEQTPSIRKAWQATKQYLPENGLEDLGGDLSLLYGRDVTPEDFLGTMSSLGGNPGFGEQLLRKQGIPGIRYLDQGSRGAGTGTHNYVVFDENIPNIVSRNGVSLSDLLRR